MGYSLWNHRVGLDWATNTTYYWQKRRTGDVAQSLGMIPLVSSVFKKQTNKPKTSESVFSV